MEGYVLDASTKVAQGVGSRLVNELNSIDIGADIDKLVVALATKNQDALRVVSLIHETVITRSSNKNDV